VARNQSSRTALRSEAVLNPKTGKMEFVNAKEESFPVSQKVIDYKRKEWEWLVKYQGYEHPFEYFFNFKGYSEYKKMALSRKQGSPERIKELEEIRKNSKVDFPVYRGQGAFETLDSKKAEKAVKEQLGDSYAENKRKQRFVGALGDGLYHTTEYSRYAGTFGPVVIEGVVDSKHLLDLRELPSEIDKRVRYEKGYEEMKRLQKERDETPEKDRGIPVGIDIGIRRAEGSFGARLRNAINDNKVKSMYEVDNPVAYVYARRYANQLVNAISKQYQENFGKKMPLDLGMTPKQKKEADTSDGTYRALKNAVGEQLYSIKNQTQWNILKTPFFKQVMKESGFDAVAYHDFSFGGDEPCVAFKNPNQFKSYFGDKKVNLKSPNMFDES